MTSQQITLVKHTWQQLKKLDPVIFGDVFYTRLFDVMPEVQHLFRSPRIDQSKKLVAMLAVVVNKLDQLESITPAIEKLAQRHVHYGVEAEHYSVVGQTLLWTLQMALGESWNKEVEDASLACYTLLSEKMIKASYREPTEEIKRA